MSDLEDENKVLRRKVQEGEEALQRAGQYGLQLLDDKMDLHNKLEEQRIEMSNVIEDLEQEKYTLQREVELKARMLESLRSEFDLVKTQQKHQMEQQQTLLERNHALDLSDLKNKVSIFAVFIFKRSMFYFLLYMKQKLPVDSFIFHVFFH
uniref:Uncharacterized protein n=1 Tax=Sinocyclocheilus rhinocerous TaxID=307959 RepID=A0A673GMM4_9TELE